ncbi:MAG TPA: hypothetical protein VK614_13685 [Allosphingosinicella sp.]|nr:hypothetical protein [Allosphingosinicella sp.]
MSFAKLLAMLQKNALYLPRVDELVKIDPFEGSVPRRYEAERIAAKRFKPVREAKLRVSAEAVRKVMLLRAAMHRKEREKTFVSCWYCAEHDSDAMWRLNGVGGDGSVAVRTTAGRLRDALPEWAYIGRVSYKDYETAVFPTCECWSPFFHKRDCFAHEKEVRVLVNPSVDNTGIEGVLGQKGLEIPMDMNSLLTAIHVSPASQPWFLAAVTCAVRDLGVECPVNNALMDAQPAF